MGVLVSKGMRLVIPSGGLKISLGNSGESTGSVRFEVSIVLFSIWLEIAIKHFRDCRVAHEALKLSHARKTRIGKGQHLETEFVHAMQCIVASPTAIDSFYASIRDHAKFSPEEKEKFENKKGTARPAHIKETVRRVFGLGPKSTAKTEQFLSTIYKFRDWAVHPPADLRAPIYHVTIEADAEWRFVAFSYSNARECLSGTISLINQLLKLGVSEKSKIQKESSEWQMLLLSVLELWKAEVVGALGRARSILVQTRSNFRVS